MEKSQSTLSATRLLASGAVAAWLLTSERLAAMNAQTYVLILVAFVLLLFVLLSKSLYDRLAWTLAFQPFGLQQVPIGGIYICLTDIMLVFLLLEASLAPRLRNQKLSPAGVLAAGILVAMCISVVLSPVMLNILGSAVRYAILLLLFVVLDRVEFDIEALATIRYGLAAGFPMAIILFYFNGDLLNIMSNVETGDRPLHSQTLPFLCTLVFPWYLLAHRRAVPLFLLSSLYAIITWVGRSRALIVMAFVTLLIVIFVKSKRNLLALSISVAVTVAGLVAAQSTVGIENVADVMGAKGESDEWRLYKMQLSMQMFREYPIIGMGPGSEFAATKRRQGEPLVSENGLIQSLADSGLVGTGLLLAMVLCLVGQWYKLGKRGTIRRDFAGALMIILVAAIAPLSFGSGVEGGALWLLLAVANKHVRWAQTEPLIQVGSVVQGVAS